MMRPILTWLWRLIWKPRPPVNLHPEDWFGILRIGTRLTLDEALSLDEKTLESLYKASVRLDAERALQIAALVRTGEEAYAAITREVDDGSAHESQIIGQALMMAQRAVGKVVEA